MPRRHASKFAVNSTPDVQTQEMLDADKLVCSIVSGTVDERSIDETVRKWTEKINNGAKRSDGAVYVVPHIFFAAVQSSQVATTGSRKLHQATVNALPILENQFSKEKIDRENAARAVTNWFNNGLKFAPPRTRTSAFAQNMLRIQLSYAVPVNKN